MDAGPVRGRLPPTQGMGHPNSRDWRGRWKRVGKTPLLRAECRARDQRSGKRAGEARDPTGARRATRGLTRDRRPRVGRGRRSGGWVLRVVSSKVVGVVGEVYVLFSPGPGMVDPGPVSSWSGPICRDQGWSAGSVVLVVRRAWGPDISPSGRPTEHPRRPPRRQPRLQGRPSTTGSV